MSGKVDALEELVADANDLVVTTKREWQSAREKYEAAMTELRVLTAMLERHKSAEQVEALPIKIDFTGVPTIPTSAEEWTAMSRTEAVEWALRVLEGRKAYTSPSDVEEFLGEHGRDDDKEAISGALAHLNRTDRAHRTGYAQWHFGPNPEKTSAAADLTAPVTMGAP